MTINGIAVGGDDGTVFLMAAYSLAPESAVCFVIAPSSVSHKLNLCIAFSLQNITGETGRG